MNCFIFSRSEYPNTNRVATVIDRFQLVIDLADELRISALMQIILLLSAVIASTMKILRFSHRKQAVSFVSHKINSTRRFPSMFCLRLLLLTVQSREMHQGVLN